MDIGFIIGIIAIVTVIAVIISRKDKKHKKIITKPEPKPEPKPIRHLKVIGSSKEAEKLRDACKRMQLRAYEDWKFIERHLGKVSAGRYSNGTYGVISSTGEVRLPVDFVQDSSIALLCCALRHESEHVQNYEEDKANNFKRKRHTDENEAIGKSIPVLIKCGGTSKEIAWVKSLNYKTNPWGNR